MSRDITIKLRVSLAEKRRLDRIAKRLEMSASAALRWLMLIAERGPKG